MTLRFICVWKPLHSVEGVFCVGCDWRPGMVVVGGRGGFCGGRKPSLANTADSAVAGNPLWRTRRILRWPETRFGGHGGFCGGRKPALTDTADSAVAGNPLWRTRRILRWPETRFVGHGESRGGRKPALADAGDSTVSATHTYQWVFEP